MRRTVTAGLVALVIAAAVAGCSSEKSRDEIVADCQKALTDSSTSTNRPSECDGLSGEDYRLVLLHWKLEQQGVFPTGDVLEDQTDLP